MVHKIVKTKDPFDTQKFPYLEVLEDKKVIGFAKRLEFEGEKCPDCGVKNGMYHLKYCDWERTPLEGEQLLTSEKYGNYVKSSAIKSKKILKV